MSEPMKKPMEVKPESFVPSPPVLAKLLDEVKGNVTEEIQTKFGVMNFNISKGGPYKFIGKSVYARAFGDWGDISGDIFGGMWGKSKKIFEELDKLTEYASDEPYDAALLTWNLFNNKTTEVHDLKFAKTELLGYTIGRFMKTDCPVPNGMDCIDIPEIQIGKGWVKRGGYADIEFDVRNAIEKDGIFESTSWKFMAEVNKQDENGDKWFGMYVACRPMSAEARNKWEQGREKTEAEKEKERLRMEQTLEQQNQIKPILIEKLNNTVFNSNPINIDINTLEKNQEGDMKVWYENGLLNMKIDEARRNNYVATPQSFSLPLKINLRAKTDSVDIRLRYGDGRLILNFVNNPSSLQLICVKNGKGGVVKSNGEIPINEFVDIEWIITKECMAVKINGELRHIASDYNYIDEFTNNAEYNPRHPVLICAAYNSTVTVESLEITEF